MTKKKQEAVQPEAAEKETGKPGSRRVYLFGMLENEVTLPVIRRLLRLNDRDPKTPIDLFINSSGGNGYNADAIIAVIHSLDAPVNTICLGHALSGACEILASGTGERSAYEFATLMFHQTLWEADGDITNIEIRAKQGQRFRNAQIELLHRCTGKDRATIRRDIERDFYMSADDALAYGIVDQVIRHSRKRGVRAAGKPDVSKEATRETPAKAAARSSSRAPAARKRTAQGSKRSGRS